MKHFLLSLGLAISFAGANAQSLIAVLEETDMVVIFGQPCIVKLADGKEVAGKLTSASMINGYLDRFTIKNDEGEKIKLEPEDVVRLSVKATAMAKIAMATASTSSIKEISNRDFNEINNREYIIFETAMRHNKAGKVRLMQLLNPGFDSRIKVFADPNAQKTMGLNVGGMRLTGGEDKSYLLVRSGEEKAILVKKGSYRKQFEEIYKDCPAMLKHFEGDKIMWDDLAGHVFVYDVACK
jgi:hypothetical protein